MIVGLDRAALAAEDVREYVDDITAASVVVAARPLVFARERTDLAANARDYVTLTALEINRTGRRSYFWYGYLWSTVDRRGGQSILAPGDRLVLLADGRPLELNGSGSTLREQGLAVPPLRAPLRTAVAVLFPASTDEIAYVAHANELRITLIHEGAGEPFQLWKDGRSALISLIRRLEVAR